MVCFDFSPSFLIKINRLCYQVQLEETQGRETKGMTRSLRYVTKAALITTCLLMVGCSKPTYYRPAADGFGYAEQKLDTNRYQVVFAGNHKTRRETAHQYVLFRAAELADREGYRYVAVNGQNQLIERYGDLFARPTERLDLGLEDGGGPASLGRNRNDDRVRSTVERYQAILDVSFYKDQDSVPADAREVYTTDEVLEEVGSSIEFESGPPADNYISRWFTG